MGVIYKIVIGEECYIGSTKNLIERQHKHNSNLNSDNYTSPIYKFCREHKIEKIILELIEDEVEEEDLKIREQFYIDKLKPTLNAYRAYNTEEDTKQKKSAHGIRYRANNKEKLKEWRENNKEELKLKKKEYYENNKEKINEKYKETVKCDLCNIEITKHNLKRHQLTATCKKMWDYMLDTDTD